MEELDNFPPTVEAHTKYRNGYKLHTIDNNPRTDINVSFD